MRGRPAIPFEDRYIPEPNSGCWIWIAARDGRGYGSIKVDGKMQCAHRVSYERFVGPIPDGLEIDHLCRSPWCINPDHMEPVTSRENTMRGLAPAAENAVKTHCVHGHPFTERNTRVTVRGWRVCLRCERRRNRKREAA